MVATLRSHGVIRASGPDIANYLQGQFSQDLDPLAVGNSAWSLLLAPNGKLVAWLRVHRVGDAEFILDLEPSVVDAVIARLERFKLRTDATFVVEEGWQILQVRGDDCPAGGELRAEVAWPGFDGTDVLGRSLDLGVDTDDGAFELARIEAGVPRVGIDLDDETIPAESGVSVIEKSVSFTKGCYTGQELVARIDSRGGNVPRPLRVLSLEAAVSVGDEVMFDGSPIGTVTSAAGTSALARILRKAKPGAPITVANTPGTVQS
jgi:folate-binding protein YgfZ